MGLKSFIIFIAMLKFTRVIFKAKLCLSVKIAMQYSKKNLVTYQACRLYNSAYFG